MDSLGTNKIVAAVLTAGVAFWGLGLVADNTVSEKRLAKSVLDIKGADEPGAGATMVAAEKPLAPIAPLLIKATAADGQAYTKKICVACHNFKEGGANKVGPALWGVVGRDQASAPGYKYSAALSSHKGKWTYAELNKWLYKPSAYAKGTKMAYAGLTNDETRANVIAYLRSLSPDPVPLPTEAEAKAEADAAAKQAAAGAKSADASTPASAEPPIAVLLAKATPEDGQAFTKKVCVVCHNFKEGGGNKAGPALYGVVGRKQDSAPGYVYSAAMQKHTGVWTYEELNKWLTKPSAYAPGTKMSYAGIANPQIRADVIDYLHTLSATPLPLPAAAGDAAPGTPPADKPSSPTAATPDKAAPKDNASGKPEAPTTPPAAPPIQK